MRCISSAICCTARFCSFSAVFISALRWRVAWAAALAAAKAWLTSSAWRALVFSAVSLSITAWRMALLAASRRSVSPSIWLADWADFSASLRTSSATTAKPRPDSPARAASMAAFSAKRLVCSAISRTSAVMRVMSAILSAIWRALTPTSSRRHWPACARLSRKPLTTVSPWAVCARVSSAWRLSASAITPISSMLALISSSAAALEATAWFCSAEAPASRWAWSDRRVAR